MGEAKRRGSFEERRLQAFRKFEEGRPVSQVGEERIVTTYSIQPKEKRVVASFSSPILNLAMPLKDTVRMAQILLTCAKELDPESTKDFTWPGMNDKLEMKAQVEAPPAAKPS